MPENKRHHFVPKFYLKRFSKDGKSIDIFNIPNQKLISGGKLKTQCFRDYLYGKEPDFEHNLANLEGVAATILCRLGDTAFSPTQNSQEWFDLLLYIIVQHSRTVAAINDLDQMTDSLLKRFLSHEPKFAERDPSKFRIRMKDSSQLAVSYGAMALPLATDLSLKILRSPKSNAFITSDNPIVYYNRLLEDDSLHSHCGIACKGLMIFAPISPQVTLLFYDKDVYNVGSSTERRLLVLRSDDVEQINGLQYVSADENVYFRGEFPSSLPGKMDVFRRETRTKMEIFDRQGDASKGSELIATCLQDIRINLSLSFVRLKKNAIEFHRRHTSLSSRPVFIPRNPTLLEGHEMFMDELHNEHRKQRSSKNRDRDGL